ncbi:unnamed protein product [Symbiodinium sp. CCMP2592]|nr:unnamed protein product [Symbiodinium sp. CCMP2592]
MTGDPVTRWENRSYGYRWEKDKWQGMYILFICPEKYSPAMLEAAMIDKASTEPGKRLFYLVGNAFACRSVLVVWFGISVCVGTWGEGGPVGRAPVLGAIRTVQAVMQEVPQAANTSVKTMAACGVKNSERDAHRMARRCQLTVPIEISECCIHGCVLPVVLLSSWLLYLVSRNLLHTLCGLSEPDIARCDAIWTCFWSRYRKIYPNHDVFRRAQAGEINLAKTIALIVHGDEGRTKKKTGILIVSCHSILGYGCEAGTVHGAEDYCKQLLNMTGHSLTSRWIFQQYLGVFTDDMVKAYRDGIKSPSGDTYTFAVIHVIGDWPWLAKAFNLSRSFANCSKQATSRGVPKGICHVCRADQPGFPFEDFSGREPKWRRTVNTQNPFMNSPPLTRLPGDSTDPTALLGQDFFHGWHLGFAKQFLGSCLVLLHEIFPGRSVPAKFQAMSDDFFSWCKANNQNPLIRKMTRDTSGWASTADYPCASWSKGSTSTVVCRWFISACARHAGFIDEGSLLQIACLAAREIYAFISKSYKAAVWIWHTDAVELSSHGFRFLALMGQAARSAYDQGRALFYFTPNCHRLHHLFYLEWDQAQKADWILNVAVFSCQTEEDYIGRPSRVSRRVAPQRVIQRTIERTLEATHAKFVQAGYVIPCKSKG